MYITNKYNSVIIPVEQGMLEWLQEQYHYSRYHKVTKENYIDFLCSLKKINHRGPDDEGIVLINTNTNDFRIIKNDLTLLSGDRISDISSINVENYNLIQRKTIQLLKKILLYSSFDD
jgi:hypothetical protein